MDATSGEVTHEWFREVSPIWATQEDMTNFDKFVKSLEGNGICESGLSLVRTPQSYQDNLRCLSKNQVYKKTVEGVYNMYVEEIKGGYYHFSKYKSKQEEESVAKTFEAATKGGIFTVEVESGPKKKKLRLEQPSQLKVRTLITNYDVPKELMDKTPQELVAVYFNQLETAAKKGGRTFFAKYGSDQSDTIFLEGENPNVFTLDHLDNMIHHVIHHFEFPVSGVTTPMVYYGTWLSTFVKHVEDKRCWSINYLHFGKPKVWFFIKPKDGIRLENITLEQIKNVMTEHFGHICKAIFTHKALFIHPKIMKINGFEVEMAIQYPGDIIVVSPGTYHWGFNCGANCAEATNFVTESWLPYGLLTKECALPNFPTAFDVQFFVLTQWPLNDYINGKLKITDPLSGLKVLVKRPNYKPEQDHDDVVVRNGHVYDFLAAKTIGKTNYVYISLYCIKTWLSQKNAERLLWEGTLKPLKFPLFLFNMELPTIKVFHKVGTVFRNYSGKTEDISLTLLENVKLDFALLNSVVLMVKNMMWVKIGQFRYLVDDKTPEEEKRRQKIIGLANMLRDDK